MAKVLVIDDELYTRVLLEIHLCHRGYDVIVAGDGWEGLQLYQHDGVTVLKEIRAIDLKQPVIVLTGNSSPETEQQVRAIGVNEFVLKSASMHLLDDTLTGKP